MHRNDFYIAGIGASAGGHQALTEFFRNLPPSPGIAFCVITHLLRDHHSILDSILAKNANLRVKRMKGSDIVQPDTVYVMPENMKAYIKDGCVFLKRRPDNEIINHTVDEFFSSLAEDCRERAIGIVLSGMGDDGSRGANVIHKSGGIVMVQDPNTTPFKPMPENAIKNDHPDQVLSPALIAKTLMAEIARRQVEVDRF